MWTKHIFLIKLVSKLTTVATTQGISTNLSKVLYKLIFTIYIAYCYIVISVVGIPKPIHKCVDHCRKFPVVIFIQNVRCHNLNFMLSFPYSIL